jgi:5-methylcytosine-specific restriction endonuclease McrA
MKEIKRNKWKRAYDDKCDALLGMDYKTATSKLERKMLLYFGKQLGFGCCYHCGFPIESEETMSLEHVKPWGGNKARNTNPCVESFWDESNVQLSHKRCNISAASGGTGYYKYIGVHPVKNRYDKVTVEYARASISVNSKDVMLGNYEPDKPEKAAIAYDIGLMAKFKGIGKLNFPNLRETYERELRNYNVDSPAFWVVRTGPIKKIVEQIYPLIKKEENNDDQGT